MQKLGCEDLLSLTCTNDGDDHEEAEGELYHTQD